MRPYIEARPNALVKENVSLFSNTILLFLLEKCLSEHDPASRVSIVKHLLNVWNTNVDQKISQEAQACRETLASEDPIRTEFWGASDPTEIEKTIEKILQNGKATAFTIIDMTLNSMLNNLESREGKKSAEGSKDDQGNKG